MKFFTLLLVFGLFSCSMPSDESQQIKREHQHEDHEHDYGNEHSHHDHDHIQSSFNSKLAEELGADEYGMRQYVIAFLKAGPNRNQNEEEANEMQIAHLENIQRLAEEGLLVLAGPFMENPELRGIYIFDVATIEEAQSLTESDPMIQSGRLIMELHPWYGSAALKKVNEIHNQIQNVNITTE